MIDPSLLEILVCPEEKTKLSLAGKELLEQVNSEIKRGVLKTCGGTLVSETLSEGLLREDGKRLYPIRSGIPILLAEEGIVLEAS
ncbi:MAG: hypothetical protein KDD55_10165 [Bdellovibrionales bacterium]|nr:hypothetical protein [Bdellovibrionales bacterium]